MARFSRSGGSRGKLLFWVVLGAIVLFEVIPGFFSETANRQPGSTQLDPAPDGQAAREQPSYALAAIRDTWPPVGKSDAAPVLSANPLAANYYVVLDGSGSMGERGCSGRDTKIQAARKAIAAFARSLPPDANFGLAVFTGNQTLEVLPLGSDNRDRVRGVLDRVEAVGNTPLRSSIGLAYRKLTGQGERQQGYGEYHLVVVTDGMASEGEDPARLVRSMLAESPVNLHTIGFCIGTDHILNQPGRSYYRAADNPAELTRGLEAVLAESPAFDVTQFTQ